MGVFVQDGKRLNEHRPLCITPVHFDAIHTAIRMVDAYVPCIATAGDSGGDAGGGAVCEGDEGIGGSEGQGCAFFVNGDGCGHILTADGEPALYGIVLSADKPGRHVDEGQDFEVGWGHTPGTHGSGIGVNQDAIGHEVKEGFIGVLPFAGEFVEDEKIIGFDEHDGAAVGDICVQSSVSRIVSGDGDIGAIIAAPDGFISGRFDPLGDGLLSAILPATIYEHGVVRFGGAVK